MKNYLKELREDRGLTLQQLAEKAKTSNQQISNLEKSKRRLTWDWIMRLAEALQCHPLEITDGPAAILPKDEQERELLKKFRGFNDGEQKMFSHMLDSLAHEKAKLDDKASAPSKQSKKK